MKAFVRKIDSKLIPLNDSDRDIFNKFKEFEDIEIELKRPRNLRFHKKFFALLNLGFQNTKQPIELFEDYREWAIMRAGHVRKIQTLDGEFYRAKSINFAKMDNLEFEEVYKSVLQVIILDTGATEQDIEDNYMQFM